MAKVVTAQTILHSKFASDETTEEYESNENTRVIIDSFSALNTDASNSYKLTVWFVPNTFDLENYYKVVDELEISPKESVMLTSIKGHVLEPHEKIFVAANEADKISFRISGRTVVSI